MTSLYNRDRFSPSYGGHAPGHLRDAFLEMIESSDRSKDPDEVMPVGDYGTLVSLYALTGLLWNCTDILPGSNCNDLDLPRGSTYAQAARELRLLWSRQP